MKRELVAVAAVTLLAQLAAFGKLLLVARLFGVGSEMDGYNLGFVLPTLIVGIVSGVLQTGLFPAYARLRVRHDQRSMARFERLVFYAVAGIAGLIALILVLAATQAAMLLTRDASPAVREATVYVLPIAAPAVLLNAVGDYLGYLLAFRGRYVIAAAAPIANAIFGAALLAAWPEGGLLNLTLGTVLGVALQVAICLYALNGLGFRPFGDLPGRTEGAAVLKEMLGLGIWILPGMVFANLTMSLPPVLLAAHGEGAVSAFGYAYRLHMSAIQLLVMAASPVILARISGWLSQGEHGIVRSLLIKAAVVAGLIGAAVVPCVWLAGAPLLQLVFGAGRFDAEAASRVAQHWTWLSLALAPAIWGNMLAKYLQADGRPGQMSALSGVGLLALGVTAMVLSRSLGEFAVAAAIMFSISLVTTLLWLIVRRSLADKRLAAYEHLIGGMNVDPKRP